MEYLISEEELSVLISKSVKLFNIQELWSNIQDFLKSKQEVREITDKSGKIRQAINWDLDLGEAKYKIFIGVSK